MSSDSPPQNPDSPKKTPVSKKTPNEGTETDLWDMDMMDGMDPDEPEDTPEPANDPSGIPTRRIQKSPIQSRKPLERQVSNPPLTEHPVPIHIPAKKTAAKKKYRKEDITTDSEPPDELEVTDDTANPEDIEHTPAPSPDQEPPDETESGSPEHSTPPGLPNTTKSFSKSEKIGTVALIAILALGAILTLSHFSNRLATRSMISEKLDLPIEGKLINVSAVSTYWREPVTSGENTDTVKRGTKLIPVLKIKVQAKSAAIRVLFRNEDGEVVGDPINRTVTGTTELTIPSTAGFDDIGMHAAYRTGESPPWLIQVLEATDSGASIDKFDTVFETEISTDIR